MLRSLSIWAARRRKGIAIAFMAMAWGLVIALGILWISSYWVYPKLSLDAHCSYSLGVYRGGIYYTKYERFQVTMVPTAQNVILTSIPCSTSWKWAFQFERLSGPYFGWYELKGLPSWGFFCPFGSVIANMMTDGGYVFTFPVYALGCLLLMAALSAHFVYQSWRWPTSHCQSCGYNLSGNPTSLTCPECGKPLTKTNNPVL
jgi:hypothetical protein